MNRDSFSCLRECEKLEYAPNGHEHCLSLCKTMKSMVLSSSVNFAIVVWVILFLYAYPWHLTFMSLKESFLELEHRTSDMSSLLLALLDSTCHYACNSVMYTRWSNVASHASVYTVEQSPAAFANSKCKIQKPSLKPLRNYIMFCSSKVDCGTAPLGIIQN